MVEVRIDEISRIALEKLLRNNVPEDEARVSVPIYIEAELWGKKSHGLRHLANNLIQYKLGEPRRCELKITRETAVSALLDGGFHFPYYIHRRAMQLAIEKAQVSGLAMVGARNGGASGLLGYYAMLATEANLIGLIINRAPNTVVPPDAKDAIIGTNPIAIGLPHRGQPPLILDMATSAGTFNQIIMAQRQGTAIPAGIALDLHGQPTTDPAATIDAEGRPRLTPLGGHKGFGLGLMFEMLCGAWLGSPMGSEKKILHGPDQFSGVYAAFRPDLFVSQEEFEQGVEQIIADLKQLPRASGGAGVRLPGEESLHRKRIALQRGTLELDDSTYQMLIN